MDNESTAIEAAGATRPLPREAQEPSERSERPALEGRITTTPPPCVTTPRKPDLRHCQECGTPFYPARVDQEFCKPGCRQRRHHRRYQRGAELYDFALEWRGKRLKGGFTRFCQMVDEWLRDERDRRAARTRRIKESKP